MCLDRKGLAIQLTPLVLERTGVVDSDLTSQTSTKATASITMKFGQNLPRNQVPEWASSYIDYKALKKLIKAALNAIEAGEDPDLAGEVGLASTPG